MNTTAKRKVSIFGATGSIGQSTISLIDLDKDAYDVVALTGGHNIEQLAKDAIRLNADVAVTAHEEHLPALRGFLSGHKTQAASGENAITEAAGRDADWVMSGIVGAAGLRPGLCALEAGATLALANKESLVTAGPLILGTAKAHNATILPVDSEHSGVFQALTGESMSSVERIIITASGGAFRDWPTEKLAQATLAQASAHPNWDMGQRITIDSASMFNKALEVIEAKEFFGVRPEQIEVIIHPQSIIHALVGFDDGALMAHLGAADMRHAIGYALNWPMRRKLPVERIDLAKIASLQFSAPDETRYPALRLAREVMSEGGLSGAVFNAAKEIALDAFIAGKIGFMQMAEIVEETLIKQSQDVHLIQGACTLDNVLAADQIARKSAKDIIRSRS